MDQDERIRRFEALVAEEPDNDIAIFSLAGEYNKVGRYADAAATYQKAIDVNPNLSKAYQLAGAALMADQRADDAAEVLDRGYRVAAERGDLMPRNAMGDLLEKLGRPIPEIAIKPAAATATSGSFMCQVTKKPGTEMTRPPFRGPIGAWIQGRASQETFDAFIALGTKIINELKLDLSRDEDDAVYDYAMRMYLGLTDEVYAELLGGAAPPQPSPEYRGVIDQILGRQGDLEQFQGKLSDRV